VSKFYKVWFENGSERTSGLVLDDAKFPYNSRDVAAYSRLFPYSEAGKMRILCKSPLFETWEDAFLHVA